MFQIEKILFKIPIALMWLLVLLFPACEKSDTSKVFIEENEIQCISSGLQFAEGPAFYNNNLYFTDIGANRIYRWNNSDGVRVFRENSGAANGLYFDMKGQLYVCEGSNKRIVYIDQNQNVVTVTDIYNGKSFNEPNDLWISPEGNIYFTDPVYNGTLTQDGQHVYCVLSNSKEVIRVTDDLVKPNGIIGDYSGSLIYIADWAASKIYRYNILNDGNLTGKFLFANVRADGLTIDDRGNLYAAGDSVYKFNSSGLRISGIGIPGTLTNLCYVKTDKELLFITTHDKVYKLILR